MRVDQKVMDSVIVAFGMVVKVQEDDGWLEGDEAALKVIALVVGDFCAGLIDAEEITDALDRI